MIEKLKSNRKACIVTALFLLMATAAPSVLAGPPNDAGHGGHGEGGRPFRHVLLISIDGMHALDFINCAQGISGINGGSPYCPTLAALTSNGVSYLDASTSKPSDSFPGLTAIISGGSPRSFGAF
jgi:predicted AlkP superfamily pyrophosphatase or phosphodiesterase